MTRTDDPHHVCEFTNVPESLQEYSTVRNNCVTKVAAAASQKNVCASYVLKCFEMFKGAAKGAARTCKHLKALHNIRRAYFFFVLHAFVNDSLLFAGHR